MWGFVYIFSWVRSCFVWEIDWICVLGIFAVNGVSFCLNCFNRMGELVLWIFTNRQVTWWLLVMMNLYVCMMFLLLRKLFLWFFIIYIATLEVLSGLLGGAFNWKKGLLKNIRHLGTRFFFICSSEIKQ